MTKKLASGIAAAAFAAALATAPAMADKSNDTLRISLDEQIPLISTYHWPVAQAGQFFRRVYQGLTAFDEWKGKFVPSLAKSWRRISPTTVEFDLRDDIKFHSGNPFTAEDVAHTYAYVGDPKLKLRFKSRFTWVKEVQKLGPHKIRVVAKKPIAADMALMAFRLLILDSKVHKSLKTKSDYGRVSASGTGPIKMIEVDRNKGVIAERYEGFKGDPKYWRAPIKRVVGKQLPDNQTKIAELLTGGIDVAVNVSPENAKFVKRSPKLAVTSVKSANMVFFAMDAANVSGNKALADVRVRRAIWMSMDRDKILKFIVPGGENADKMKALCFKSAKACKWTRDSLPYDLAKAKKLMAEAGYPKGFKMTFHVISRIKEIGEAMANEWRKIGVDVKVQPTNIGVYRRKQGRGELQSWLIAYPAGSFPDAGNHLNVFFRGSRSKYMGKDPIIIKAMNTGAGELNPEKRANIYAKAYDRANEMVYNMAVTSLPFVFAHTKEVRPAPSQLSAGDIHVTDFFWK